MHHPRMKAPIRTILYACRMGPLLRLTPDITHARRYRTRRRAAATAEAQEGNVLDTHVGGYVIQIHGLYLAKPPLTRKRACIRYQHE